MRIKYCMGCKTEPAVIGGFCIECDKKHCSKCGRVSVHQTRWDDTGKPYCPSCFKKLLLFASQVEGKTTMPTIESKLLEIFNRLDRIERLVSRMPNDRPTSNEDKTIDRRRDIPSLESGADFDSRIDSMLNNLDLDTPSVDEIKQKALETMLENDKESQD